jgi:hypothetical protein
MEVALHLLEPALYSLEPALHAREPILHTREHALRSPEPALYSLKHGMCADARNDRAIGEHKLRIAVVRCCPSGAGIGVLDGSL